MKCIILLFTGIIFLLNLLKKTKYVKPINNKTYVLLLCSIVILYIVISIQYKEHVGDMICSKDLERVYVKSPKITGWEFSHFILYFIIGIFSPKFYEILFFGVLWEIFEYVYGVYTNRKKYWTSGGVQGQLTDIIMNILGFLLGSFISRNF